MAKKIKGDLIVNFKSSDPEFDRNNIAFGNSVRHVIKVALEDGFGYEIDYQRLLIEVNGRRVI